MIVSDAEIIIIMQYIGQEIDAMIFEMFRLDTFGKLIKMPLRSLVGSVLV